MKLVVSSVLSLNTLALTWTRLLWALPIPAGWLHRRSDCLKKVAKHRPRQGRPLSE